MLFRWIFGLPFAALVTAALFFMMSGLIGADVRINAQKAPPDIKIVAEPPPDPAGVRGEKPPIFKDPPPETVIPKTLPGPKPEGVPVGPEKGPVERTPIGPGAIAAPVIKHAPQYPESCRSRGAEGDVLVQFDVTPKGDVVNIRILESADSCFNRTVRNTVAKWKFPPAGEGRTARRSGLVERFSFQLVQ